MKKTALFLSFLALSLSSCQYGAWADIVPHQPAGWVIEKAEYTGEIEERIARVQAVYHIEILRSGYNEVPLELPGAMITDMRIERSAGDAHLLPRGRGYALMAQKKGRYEVEITFAKALEGQPPYEGLQVGIPQATFSRLELFVPRQDVELRAEDKLYVRRDSDARKDGVVLRASLGARTRIDMQWSARPSEPEKTEPVLTADVFHLVTLEDALAHVRMVVDYKVSQGSAETFTLRLPLDLNILNVRGHGIKDWHSTEAHGVQVLEVQTDFKVREALYRLIVEGEQVLAEPANDYSVPSIQVVGVKREQGYVALARQGNIEISPVTSEGINRIDVRELPSVLTENTPYPVSLAYRYYSQPYTVQVAVVRHEDHAVLAAIAEQADLATLYSRQGQIVTRARYALKSNKKQFLEVALPEDAVLWSCLVNGQSVKPVHGDQAILVPLQRGMQASENASVELVYLQKQTSMDTFGTLVLESPVLDVPTTVANWDVYMPQNLLVTHTGGNVDRGRADVGYIDDPLPLSDGVTRGSWAQNVAKSPAMLRFADRKHRATAAFEQDFFAEAELVGAAGAYSEVGGRETEANRPDTPERLFFDADGSMRQAGIMPLKIRIPRSGKVYSFSRLVASQEPLHVEADYVHLPQSVNPWWGLGLGSLIIPIGGAVFLVRKRG